ncbi:MAG TPA: Rieske (2Fe-2S) protein [Natronosporangium sp.]
MTDESAKTTTASARPATTTRRAVFAGAGAVGAAAVLAACGTDTGGDPYTGEPAGNAEPPAAPPASESSAGEAPPAEQGGDAEAGLALTSDVEVGGGVVLSDQDVVITQPVAGEWKGFSATCTHQGCPVAEVSDGTINCNCHGSKFSIADGSVVDGPAPRPLPEKPVAVDGDWVVLA